MPTAAPLVARAVTAKRGAATILDAVDLTVAMGDVVGLVGPNGVGKSTLLAVLGGDLQPESGRVERTPPTATVGLLPQEPHRDDGELVVAFVSRRTGVAAATVELEAATAALAAGAPGSDTRYDEALQRWLSLGAADLDARIGEVWAELGLSPDVLAQPTATLSGGEAARVGLAALLLSRFDAYLLDEPTNDLDLDGLARLERWVTEQPAGIVLVSHDRTFLSRTVNAVVEIDEFTHRATRYDGGWDAYLEERATAARHAWERFEDYDAKRTGLAERAQREREWASQGLSKVRNSDEKDKNIRAFRKNQTEQLAGRAARTDRAIDRLEVVDKPRTPWELRFVIGTAGRSGDVVSRLNGAVVRRGASPAGTGAGAGAAASPFVLGPIDLIIAAGERVAILGANGSGKSTLLDLILGRIEPDEGSSQLGASIVVGEVEQVRRQLTGSSTLLRAFQDETGYDASDARTLLAKFGLVADHVLRPTESLSPGERTRASLALLMARQVNLLVLDEPTNHLDLPAIDSLEQALDTFPGTVLLVTHDRSLLEHVRLTRTIRLDAGRVVSDTIAQPV
ncbi:ABC-F family ATP-binding cassette domain-containing protein [Desertimonas flava]|uniref:ABC-F family ATP-binding cassette domain-containing protein n=1 Tax=Desertimonas flava TaxID=2064846 RepID=UPI000E343D79|nr:ABC-F family ATP-binding cassette domain-containing protein [Desertimonas flava]